jgi:hypothetical protein
MEAHAVSEESHTSERQFSRLRRDNRRLRVVLVSLLCLIAAVALFAQARPATASPSVVLRYQLGSSGAVPVVFDTQTGKSFVWMPRDEKTGDDPYLMIRDPVNSIGMSKPIRWTDERTK